jgi:toxin ParE1/3/4
MLKIKWSNPALASLSKIEEYIAQDNQEASTRVSQYIYNLTKTLAITPNMGVGGRKPNTRELFGSKYPYVIVYQVQENIVYIVQILHTKQRYPKIDQKH